MGNRRLRKVRTDPAKLSVDGLRERVEDYVAANRDGSYEDCVAAMIAEGFPIPRGGTRALWKLWDQARQDNYGRRVRG